MHWCQFVMDLGRLSAEAVEAVFLRHGAQAVTLSDAGDDPVLEPGPGETPLWRDTRLTGLFAPDTDFGSLCGELKREFSLERLPAHRIEPLEDRVWEREWLEDFRPMRFGERLWVCPSGRTPGAPRAVVVELDPGLAFGTGTHPTTAMCLEWLDRLAPGELTVMDFGCGSGILAIAALKLGAAGVVAVDIDPQARRATAGNAARNGVAGRLSVVAEPPAGTFDVVVANVLAAPLVAQADALLARLGAGGRLALSGILASQLDTVADAYRHSIAFESPAQIGHWVRLTGRKR